MGSKLGSSTSSILSHMRPMSQVVDEANSRIVDAIEGRRDSYITRWMRINQTIESIQESELVVIGGRPGSGKSAFANLLVQDIFNKELNPYKSMGLYFSLEMPAYQQVVRWYSNAHQIESKSILSSRNPIKKSVYENLRRTGHDLTSMNVLFHDISLHPKAIANTVVDAIRRNKGFRIFLIVDHSRLVTGSDQERLRIEELVTYCHTLNNKYGVIVILLSQMNRDIEKERDRTKMGNSLPVMADLFAASAMEQFATTILLLHRPEMYAVKKFMGEDAKNLLAINVAKQRSGWTGAVLMRSNFPFYDVHDGNTVLMTEDGYVFRFAD